MLLRRLSLAQRTRVINSTNTRLVRSSFTSIAHQLHIANRLPIDSDPPHNHNPDESVTIHGWVRSCRKQKNVSFAVLNDGSSVDGIQVVVPKGLEAGLTVGASVALVGKLVDSPGKGQAKELRAESVEVLGASNAEVYPIQNTKQGIPETILRRNAHLRPRTSATAAMLRMRSEMALATHRVLADRLGFVNVQTPIITSSDCEGAGEVFRVESGPPPTPNPSSPTPPSPPVPPPSPRYLTVSSQLHLEALAASLVNVYTLSPTFRAEKSDTSRHLQEFWMLEAELGFLPAGGDGLAKVMDVVEHLIRGVANHFSQEGFGEDDVEYFDKVTPGIRYQLHQLSYFDPEPFARITYTEAIKILEEHVALEPDAFVYRPSWGAPIQTEHEKWLAESYAHGPIFVTDYPIALKPFYMLPNPLASDQDPARQTCACFDLLVPRLGELVGGSLREHREEELVRSMEMHGLKKEDYDWYLDLRRYGTTRHGGFGLGWERFVAWLTGIENVRDCIAFPRAAEGTVTFLEHGNHEVFRLEHASEEAL